MLTIPLVSSETAGQTIYFWSRSCGQLIKILDGPKDVVLDFTVRKSNDDILTFLVPSYKKYASDMRSLRNCLCMVKTSERKLERLRSWIYRTRGKRRICGKGRRI